MLEKIEFHHLASLVVIILIFSITTLCIVSIYKDAEINKFAIEHGCKKIPTPNAIGVSHWGDCKISNSEGK